MQTLEWIKFIAGTIFIVLGIVIFIIELIGVYRFKYVLNRMHAAAMGDTLGIACVLIGLMIMSGLHLMTLKMLCIIVFLWFSSPTSSHLIARLEIMTNEDKEERFYRFKLGKRIKENIW